MKRTLLLTAAVLAIITSCNALNNNIKLELKTLDATLSKRSDIEAVKRAEIDSLYHVAAVGNDAYSSYRFLFEEYKSYNYDTALIYVNLLEKEAVGNQIDDVKLCRAFVYLSGGLFKEATDILENWIPTDSALILEYYFIYARLMWDLADNVGGEVGEEYNQEGIRVNNQVQKLLNPTDSAMYWYCLAVSDLREGNYTRGIERCLISLSASQPSEHFRAMSASTLAYMYRLMGDSDTALHYYIDAAINDILSSTYETVALRNIAELLFEAGETEQADRYIHLAMKDAQRYHARHRQVSIAQSLPIIEERMLSKIRQQQHLAWSLFAVVVVLLIIGIIEIIILVKKNKTVHLAQHTIDDMNRSLVEANRLKEELLGSLLVRQSQYINAVLRYQQDVKQYGVNRQWSALQAIPKQADARLQRIALDRQLDNLLLSLYPTFVKDFNALLRQGEQITLKKDELLNTQLRIFALIRLGITHNEVIAEILDYSINTIYSYKTRMIAQSDLSPNTFYAALMQIPSFSKKKVRN